MKRTFLSIFKVSLLLSIVILIAFSFGCRCRKSDGKKKVTLRIIMWTNPASVDFIENLNERFSEKYPNIKVDLTHAPTETYEKQMRLARVTAGDVDIVAVQGFVGASKEYTPDAAPQYWELWINSGMLEPLDNQSFIKNYKKDALENASSFNGKIYSIPTGATAFSGIFYNKDIFKKYNIRIPKTFNELIKVCETLKSNGVKPMTLAGKDIWPLTLPVQAIIGCLFPDQEKLIKGLWTGDIKYTDPQTVEVFKRTQKLMNYFEEGFQGVDYLTIASRFSNGHVAMIPDGIWQQAKIDGGKPEFEYGYFLLPGSDNPEDNKYLFGKYDLAWSVLSKSENKDAALKWLKFFSEKENYTEFINKVGFIPTQPNVELKNEFINKIAQYPMKLAWDQIRIGKQTVGQYAVDVGFRAQFLKPLGSIETPEELAGKTQADWDAASK